MNDLPNEIALVLKRFQLEPREIVFWMACDRAPDGGFAESWLLLGRDKLHIVRNGRPTAGEKTFKGYLEPKKGKRSFRIPGAARPEAPGPSAPAASRDADGNDGAWTVETLDLARIESVAVVNLVASGLMVIKETEERAVAAFTNGHMRRAAKFAAVFRKLKDGEALDEGELEEEHGPASCPKCGMVYPEEGRQMCPRCLKRRALFLRLLAFAGRYKGSIFWIVVFMLLNSATGIVIPYLQGTVLFDQALAGQGAFAGRIGLVILLIIVFRTLSLLFGVLYGYLNARLAANVAFDLKAGVFSAMQRLSLHFFMRKQTGHLMTRVNGDATELQFFFTDGISFFIVNAMNIIGITAVLVALDWRLTLFCFVPMPAVIWLVRKAFPRLWRLSWRRHRRASAMNSVISDTIRGSRVVKAFGKEEREIERFRRANHAYSSAEQTVNKLSGTVMPTLNILTQLGGIAIWAFGGWKVMQGDFSFGKVMTFIHYMYMLYGPIQFMTNIVGWWSHCMSAAQRIFEIQDAVPDVAEKPDAIDLPDLRGEIRAVNVVFGYEPNKPILKGVSLHVRPGQMIGIVGHSGAGKSTLVNLISRLYDVNEGEILIDGVNVKDLKTATLRRHIGIVSQDIYVFSGTIAENIAYAKPDCTLGEIIRAAKIARAHDFIEKLPDGYDTIVGTGGHTLSGGEKQRLSIARAILLNPKILILDEATASLDTETELQIQEALDTLVKGRTTIAIAHRLSTLRNADVLVVMDKGVVAETGTHEELMARKGLYYEMVKRHDEALKMKEAVIV